ncbi:terminase small subunit [Acinetobacter baumannii]
MAGLTKKQKRFVEEYQIDLNATQAYIRAGSSAKNDNIAGVEAHKLLRNPKIEDAVAEAMNERSKRTEITADMVLNEYAKIGFSNISDYLKINTSERVVDFEVDEDGNRKPIKEWVQSVELFDTDSVDREKMDAVAEIKQTKDGIALKLHDKKGALDSIARHLGMFTDKIEHSGSISYEQLLDDLE